MANIVPQSRQVELILLPMFMATIDHDYKTNISQPALRSLADLSLEKLLSDVYLIYRVSHHIPIVLHRLLLQKALNSNRILSIIHLLKCYPEESFHFPIPCNLNNWSVFSKQNKELLNITNSFRKTADTVIHTFFNIINNSLSSHLQILDMGEFSIETSLLVKFLDNINLLKTPPQHPYLLKTGLKVSGEEDLKKFTAAKMAASISAYIKMNITGLHVYTRLRREESVWKFLKLLKDDELQHFSIDICFSGYNDFFPYLSRYHNLQSLSVSYVQGFTLDADFLTLFSKTLNSLPNLKRLCLRGSCLSNCLRTLFKLDCRTDYLKFGEVSRNCCTIHRGKLEYLDIAGCRVKSDDLLCLAEFSQTKVLKYLDLCESTHAYSELSEAMKMLGSSLVVLNIERCYPHPYFNSGKIPELFSALESMFMLKFLNLRSIPVSIEDLELLSNVVKKMPELRNIFLEQPLDYPTGYCDYYKNLMSENKVDIFWY